MQSSTLAWEISWTEGTSRRVVVTGVQRVRHDQQLHYSHKTQDPGRGERHPSGPPGYRELLLSFQATLRGRVPFLPFAAQLEEAGGWPGGAAEREGECQGEERTPVRRRAAMVDFSCPRHIPLPTHPSVCRIGAVVRRFLPTRRKTRLQNVINTV